MDLLTDQLRAAAADPPPSRIDLDALLAGERRRRQRIAVGGVAAAVLALAVAVPLILGYPAPPGGPVIAGVPAPGQSPPGPSPVAGAPQDAEASRLTGIFAGWLRAALPAATLTDPNSPPGSPAPWFLGEAGNYKAGVQVVDAAGLGHVFALLIADLPPCTTEPHCETGPDCPTPEVDGTYCELRPDGTKVFVVSVDNAGMISHQVSVYAPDGTIAQTSASNFGRTPSVDPTETAGGVTIRCSTTEPKTCDDPPGLEITRLEPPLTVAQLIEISLDLAA